LHRLLDTQYYPQRCGWRHSSTRFDGLIANAPSEHRAVRRIDRLQQAVIGELVNGPRPWRELGTANRCDVAIVHHEYGLYGGATATRCWTSSPAPDPSIVIATRSQRPPAPAVPLVGVAAMRTMSSSCRTQLEPAMQPVRRRSGIIATIPHGARSDGPHPHELGRADDLTCA